MRSKTEAHITITFHRTIVKEKFLYFPILTLFLRQQIYKQWRQFVPYLSTPNTELHFYCQSFAFCTIATNIIFM